MSNEAQALWYVVHTYSGYENKVAENIERLVEYRGLQSLIFETRIPTEIVVDSQEEADDYLYSSQEPEYDDDGNGWIDEDDEIWDKLMIWCMDDSGKTELYHISEKGIGAICLKNVSSDFSLNSLKTNQTNAAVRNTGIFLYENGNVGTVQHMDLAI